MKDAFYAMWVAYLICTVVTMLCYAFCKWKGIS